MIYTNKFINLISFVLTIIIFFIICFFVFYKNMHIKQLSEFVPKIDIIKDNKKDNENSKSEEKTSLDLGSWYIEIPSINLSAPIAEGTDNNTLNTKVGHFVDSAIESGNIGLAGHNRGYEYNFFQDLKKLKKEDQIIYTHESFKKIYIVDKIEIIENSDWSYLKESENNKITLITCIENQPQYRRCVQAVELEN